MTNNSRISKIVVSNIMPNNIKVVPISIMNKKLGKLHTETTCDSVCTSYITTKIKNKFGKELAKEDLSIKPETSFGLSIEVNPEYQNKGYRLGEILRLSSIMAILENKVNEFLIFSLPSAIFFHSKYKFVPSIIKPGERDNALMAMINNCDRKYYGDIKLEAEKILAETKSCNTYEKEKNLCDLTNKLLEKYITRIITFGDNHKAHPFKYGRNEINIR